MQVLVMRHGIAVERDDRPESDITRPLTEEGERKTRLAARGLGCLRPNVDLIASSCTERTLQTAAIAREELEVERAIESWNELHFLEDEDADLEPLRARILATASACLLLVGHEPGCSRLLSLLTCGEADALVMDWKKAGVAWLQVEAEGAILRDFLAPKTLRNLARKAGP